MKPTQTFSKAQIEIIGKCLNFSLKDEVFPHWEFFTLMGLTLEEVQSLAMAWPEVDLSDSLTSLALNNVLLNLIDYPHGAEDILNKEINSSSNIIQEIYDKFNTISTHSPNKSKNNTKEV